MEDRVEVVAVEVVASEGATLEVVTLDGAPQQATLDHPPEGPARSTLNVAYLLLLF